MSSKQTTNKLLLLYLPPPKGGGGAPYGGCPIPIGGPPPTGIPIGGLMGGGGPPMRGGPIPPMGPPGGKRGGPLSSPSKERKGGGPPPMSLRGLPLGSRIFVQFPMCMVAYSPGGVLMTI
ncbi:hypothetical protein Emag_003965 [Eimeria magna]